MSGNEGKLALASGTVCRRDRQTDTQADTQADRQTDRQTDRQAGRQTDRQTEDRETDRQKDRRNYSPKHVELIEIINKFITVASMWLFI